MVSKPHLLSLTIFLWRCRSSIRQTCSNIRRFITAVHSASSSALLNFTMEFPLERMHPTFINLADIQPIRVMPGRFFHDQVLLQSAFFTDTMLWYISTCKTIGLCDGPSVYQAHCIPLFQHPAILPYLIHCEQHSETKNSQWQYPHHTVKHLSSAP